MSIFDLAYLQLEREGLLNSINESDLMLDRAKIIRNWLIQQRKNKELRARQIKK